MTKKHCIALADALRHRKPDKNWDPDKMVQWELDVKALADVCAHFNNQLYHTRWMSYIVGECGPSGGTVKKVHSPARFTV
jgi:hypothetical protein